MNGPGPRAADESRDGWIGAVLAGIVSAFLVVNSLLALGAAHAMASPAGGMGAVVMAYILYLSAIPHVVGVAVVASWVAAKGWRAAPVHTAILAFGVLAPLPLLHMISAPSREQAERLHAIHEDRARFSNDQRSVPFGTDLEMLTMVRSFQVRGDPEQGSRLRNAIERRTAKAVIGESHRAPTTVGEAIDAEKSPPEKIVPLLSRVVGLVTVEALPESTPVEGAPADLRFRWLARNGTTAHIDHVTVLVSEWTNMYDDRLLLICKPVQDQAIAPRTSAVVACQPEVAAPATGKALAMLRDDAMRKARPVSAMMLADKQTALSRSMVSFGVLEREAGLR